MTSADTTDLNQDETAVFYPTLGYFDPKRSTWKLTVAGVIHRHGELRWEKRILLRMLRRYYRVPEEAAASELFHERIRDFTAQTERGKRVVIEIGSARFTLKKKTKRNGQFSGSIYLTTEELVAIGGPNVVHDGWLQTRIVPPIGDYREFSGRVLLAKNSGLSVISDIDDTIKATDVANRESLVANTFFRPFRSIDGMADLYRSWSLGGVSFHYVSSSPWQLYRPLSGMWAAESFPAGTFHLRSFRLRDHMLRRLFRLKRNAKFSDMKEIVRALPGRKFMVVGDSGERDPELYGELARRFPDQVDRILIRELPSHEMCHNRIRKAFRKVLPEKLRIFSSASELADIFPNYCTEVPLATIR